MTSLPSPAASTPTPPARRTRPHGKEPVGRERILAAAAQLFVEHGYAETTTRQISASVGIKQPSLYYHFPNKSSMLVELLVATAEPSVVVARQLLESPEGSGLTKLLSLIRFDVELLASGEWNTGSLYLLPETSAPECATFRQLREELKRAYSELVARAVAAGEASCPDVQRTAALIFSLVEGVILRRNDERDLDAKQTAHDIEEATLLILKAKRS